MLKLDLPEVEQYNESTNEFIYLKKTSLQLEHSLVSISKWEQKWHKAFFGREEKTAEEVRDYIRCMTLTQNVDPEVYKRLGSKEMKEIEDYISNPMTATWFSNEQNKNKKSNEVITSELIYYWMIAFQIPVEFQKWHINRLLTLIKVCEVKNEPPKKMSRKEILSRNSALNEARRKANHTTG